MDNGKIISYALNQVMYDGLCLLWLVSCLNLSSNKTKKKTQAYAVHVILNKYHLMPNTFIIVNIINVYRFKSAHRKSIPVDCF